MAEAVGVVASTVALIDVSFKLLRVSAYLYQEEFSTLYRTYGRYVAFLMSVFFKNTASEYARIEDVVLQGDDREALLFRDSVATECNMTAVAGAIIAQVALTALSLPNLSLAHWTARAFLLFATVAGCLSVYYACRLQRTIGKLYRPEMVRDWLSVGSRRDTMKGLFAKYPQFPKDRKASLSAIFLLSAPYTMMSYSILAFVTGLAIYQGFTWTRNLDTAAGATNSRNIFIAYMVGTGYCQLFFLTADVFKYIEGWVNFGLVRVKQAESPEEQVHESQETGGRRDGNNTFQMEEHLVGGAILNAPITSPAPPQEQRINFENAVANLTAMLEAAATAHEVSAEAERRVASGYRNLYEAGELSSIHRQ